MLVKHLFALLLSLLLSAPANAQADSTVAADTARLPAKAKKNTVFRRIGSAFTKVFKGFNEIDRRYIEPQHYNYTLMIQNTNTYEIYKLTSKSGQSITFAPKPTYRVGPYVGWRWIFLGYTFDLKNLNTSKRKTEFDLSLYSSLFGIDLYYRKTGDDYRIREASLSDGNKNQELKGVPFSGLSVSIKGFDVYYIFNHKRFSYPAAFSQSTNQRRSAGSPLIGIGYTAHNLKLNSEKLKEVVESATDKDGNNVKLDSGLMFKQVRYSSYSVSGGYAYNWVFARNWLFAASLSMALAYKKSNGDLESEKSSFAIGGFYFDDINLDGIGRFGVVWNNTKYYAGMSTIIHSFNYRKSQFSTNNVFGSLNFYVGINIGRK